MTSNMIPANIITPALFLVWVLMLWLVKNVIMRRLKKWASKTSQNWDDILVSALAFPLNFLIFASGLAIFSRFLSLSDDVDGYIRLAYQGSIVFAAVFFLDSLVRSLVEHYAAKSVFKEISSGVVKNVIRGIVIGLGILIFMDMIGISITPILASLGIGSLAVALALQDTLANFFAGIYLAIDRPVRVGDYVKLETGDEGYVVDVSWRSTRIRTLPNNVVIIPNKKLMESVVTNYYLPDMEMAVLVQMGVHYDTDLERVEKIVAEEGKAVMKSVPGGVPEFEPFIRYHTFGESSINFTVILRGKEYVDQHLIKHEFMKRITARFRKENIIIPYPIRTLQVSPETLSRLKPSLQ